MVVKCIVQGCKSEWHPGCDIIFHSFPSNPTERNKWLNVVELKRPFFEKAKICSLHFKPMDYMSTGKRLRQGVTPFFKEVANSSPVQTQVNKENQPLGLPHTVQDAEESDILIISNEEYATSAASKRTWETMSAIPSCSHESWPLRDATKENLNVAVCKKPRLLLKDILEPKKEDRDIKYVLDKSTSPVQILCADKSVQARIKSSREEALMIKNKSLVQKVFRLNKTMPHTC